LDGVDNCLLRQGDRVQYRSSAVHCTFHVTVPLVWGMMGGGDEEDNSSGQMPYDWAQHVEQIQGAVRSIKELYLGDGQPRTRLCAA